MRLMELLADIVESIGQDATSPIPGLITLATIIRMLESLGYPGKGKNETLSSMQRAKVKRMLNSYFERRVVGRQCLYGPRISNY